MNKDTRGYKKADWQYGQTNQEKKAKKGSEIGEKYGKFGIIKTLWNGRCPKISIDGKNILKLNLGFDIPTICKNKEKYIMKLYNIF